jgi:tetratricopeptide (TPR) repeat protein
MAGRSRSNRCGICRKRTRFAQYNEEVNQLSWVIDKKAPFSVYLLFSLLLALTSLTSSVGQSADPNHRTLIHGLIVTAQGRPVAHATVEMRDLRGIKMATGFTDTNGSFAMTTSARHGEYVLLAAKELQVGDERIILDQPDHEVTIELPSALVSAAEMPEQIYTVSAQELRMPAKARAHLRLAQQKFSKSNFAGAEKEIDQALQADSMCAPAFSMRALLRLAARDLDGAAEDATRALALDSGETDAYLALATVYNAQGEFQKSEAAARRVLGMRPDLWQGGLELAKAFYGQGRLVLALRELDELNRDFPDVHLVRANILVRLNRSDEAMKEFSQFLREAPNDPRREQVERILTPASGTATPLLYPSDQPAP